MDYPLNGLDMHSIIYTGTEKSIKYDLYGVVHYYGDMEEGHYISECRLNPRDQNWY